MMACPQEISALLGEFSEPIDSLRKGQKPKYSMKQIQILESLQKETFRIEKILSLMESFLLRQISSTQIYLATIFVDRMGISFIARQQFQKLSQALQTILSTNMQIMNRPNIPEQIKQHIVLFINSVNTLTYVCLQKFAPIQIDRHTQEIQIIHQLNKKIYLEYTIEVSPSFPVEQSQTDGFFIQLNLIVKDILRQFSQIRSKERRDLKLKKLTSIIEQEGDLEQEEEDESFDEVLGEQNENELDEMLSQSMKLSGQKIEYNKTLQYGGLTQEQKNLKISQIVKLYELQNEILSFIQSKKLTLLEFELLTYQKRQLQKLSSTIVQENSSIAQEVGQVLKMASNKVIKQVIDQPIQLRTSFQLREFLKKSENIPCEFRNFLLPIKDSLLIEELSMIICNFLNNKGGIILLGVIEANHQVVGADISKKKKEEFSQFFGKLLNIFQPSLEQEVLVQFVEIVNVPTLKVIRICVQQGSLLDKVYTYKNQQNEIISSFKEGVLNLQSQQELLEEMLKVGKSPKKAVPKIQVSQIVQESEYQDVDLRQMSTSSTIHHLVKFNKDRSIRERAGTNPEKAKLQQTLKQMTPVKVEKKLDEKQISNEKTLQSPAPVEKQSPLKQKSINSHRIDIALFQAFEQEILLKICQQILGPYSQLTLQYEINLPNSFTITVLTSQKRFYESVKNRIFTNYKEIKDLKVVRKIKADMEGIFEIQNTNQQQLPQIDNNNIIIIIGYQQKYRLNLIQLLQEFIKIRKIDLIKFDTEFHNSITIIMNNSEGLNSFMRGVTNNKELFKQYGFEKILKFGSFAGSLSLSNLDESVLQYLATLGYKGEKQMNNYIKYQIDNYRDCSKLYDYFFQLQSNQIRNGIPVNQVIGIVMNLNNTLMI